MTGRGGAVTIRRTVNPTAGRIETLTAEDALQRSVQAESYTRGQYTSRGFTGHEMLDAVGKRTHL